ncbi:hypothetical protein HDU97_003472 [Phlyctochytrium planicorne]|nr:hypothetical protein HDU97_003472 [Phlyctochytrium planicorne]
MVNIGEDEDLGIAGKKWPAADVIAKYFGWRYGKIAESQAPIRFLELGSGTGVSSILLADILKSKLQSFHIIATDLELAVDLIRKNILENKLSDHVSGERLEWGQDNDADSILKDGTIDMVFASDVVYYPELFDPLIKTLLYLTNPNKQAIMPEVIICCRMRELSKELPFYGKLGKEFHIYNVAEWDDWSKWREAGFLLLRLERRGKPLETDGGDEFDCLLMNWMSPFDD